jgi:hypothetical protein
MSSDLDKWKDIPEATRKALVERLNEIDCATEEFSLAEDKVRKLITDLTPSPLTAERRLELIYEAWDDKGMNAEQFEERVRAIREDQYRG